MSDGITGTDIVNQKSYQSQNIDASLPSNVNETTAQQTAKVNFAQYKAAKKNKNCGCLVDNSQNLRHPPRHSRHYPNIPPPPKNPPPNANIPPPPKYPPLQNGALASGFRYMMNNPNSLSQPFISTLKPLRPTRNLVNNTHDNSHKAQLFSNGNSHTSNVNQYQNNNVSILPLKPNLEPNQPGNKETGLIIQHPDNHNKAQPIVNESSHVSNTNKPQHNNITTSPKPKYGPAIELNDEGTDNEIDADIRFEEDDYTLNVDNIVKRPVPANTQANTQAVSRMSFSDEDKFENQLSTDEENKLILGPSKPPTPEEIEKMGQELGDELQNVNSTRKVIDQVLDSKYPSNHDGTDELDPFQKKLLSYRIEAKIIAGKRKQNPNIKWNIFKRGFWPNSWKCVFFKILSDDDKKDVIKNYLPEITSSLVAQKAERQLERFPKTVAAAQAAGKPLSNLQDFNNLFKGIINTDARTMTTGSGSYNFEEREASLGNILKRAFNIDDYMQQMKILERDESKNRELMKSGMLTKPLNFNIDMIDNELDEIYEELDKKNIDPDSQEAKLVKALKEDLKAQNMLYQSIQSYKNRLYDLFKEDND